MLLRNGRRLSLVSLFVGAFLTVSSGAAAQDGASEITFTKDIAPILQRSCQDCHRTDSIAPRSLLTYEEARPWARSIKDKVVTRAMPPWYIDKNIGIQGFKYDYSLTDDEISKVANWVDNGAPRGNPADMPAPREFVISPSGKLASRIG